MNRDEIRDSVIASIRYLQTDPEHRDVTITDSTKPITNLGFESDDGVDFACELSSKIGFKIPDDVNPFIDDSGERALSIGEIVNLVFELQSVEASNG
jgi:acyl carrier protein